MPSVAALQNVRVGAELALIGVEEVGLSVGRGEVLKSRISSLPSPPMSRSTLPLRIYPSFSKDTSTSVSMMRRISSWFWRK